MCQTPLQQETFDVQGSTSKCQHILWPLSEQLLPSMKKCCVTLSSATEKSLQTSRWSLVVINIYGVIIAQLSRPPFHFPLMLFAAVFTLLPFGHLSSAFTAVDIFPAAEHSSCGCVCESTEPRGMAKRWPIEWTYQELVDWSPDELLV